MAAQSSKPRRHIGRYILLFIAICIAGLEIFRRNVVSEYEKNFLTNYVPSPEIAEIVEKLGLTDVAKKIFYKSDPEFLDASNFARYCLGTKKGVELALACARSGTPDDESSSKPRIFLFKIDNPKFADSRFPSAAHEILHIAYRQLESVEKERIGLLIDAELAKRPKDAHLTGIVNIIKQSTPEGQEEIRSEMHSILGVEYLDLSPELDQYYAQYFSNRSQLVALYTSGGFEQRMKKLNQLDQQLASLNSELTSMKSQQDAYLKSGELDKYNAGVAAFNAKVNEYNVKAKESRKLFSEVESLYKLINPNFQVSSEK